MSAAKKTVEAWIKHVWGERCSDFSPNCPTCDAWVAFDDPDTWFGFDAPTPEPRASVWAYELFDTKEEAELRGTPIEVVIVPPTREG
jgi:hypothetical protein